MENFNVVAWWGAVLSTIVFVWNIAKWLLSAPKLQIKVFPNSYEWKGKIEILPDEIVEQGVRIKKMKPFVIVEVRNVGRGATTLLNIRLSQSDTPKGMEKTMDTTESCDPLSEPLPAVVDAGHVWLCRFDQIEATKNRMENGTPHLSIDIRHTHAKGWVRRAFEIEDQP